ncbi:HAD-IIIA family hydrolase [Planosporangium thailandense]|uniref:HAD-IIIA family hydrolase n=1 Tax=Planosporangium thailandense TaxID=765197 RepID=UPI0030B8219C
MLQSQGFAAALLDRDGTLVLDVPYNGDPDQVRPVPGAREALDRLRAAGLRLGVVSNQSGIARGLLTHEQVRRVNARIEELLGPFDTWHYCPHGPDEACDCRKPAPGMIRSAAAALGVPIERCVMIGDIGADVTAGLAAGAATVLVPTPVTRAEEIAAAPVVATDLAGAVDWILAASPHRPRVLVARCDSVGDVLVTGPAIRAVAAGASYTTLLCGPRGLDAARLLPGVDDLIDWRVPWIDPQPPPVDSSEIDALVKDIEARQFDKAVIFTSFHQSPLPLALLLRLAGVPYVAAISEDYPGSLLDVRHRGLDDNLPEAERALSLAGAAGFALPPGDDGRLRLRRPLPTVEEELPDDYVVVHPGASVPARACPPERCRDFVAALAAAGHRVVVTGAPSERDLTRYVAADAGLDLGGRTTLAQLAAVLERARCVVVANTGPAHLAAAVGTPVVSLFAPTVPYERWHPYGVPVRRLGNAHAPCRDTRAAVCPVPGHPCLSEVATADLVAAVEALTARCDAARNGGGV